MAERLSVASIVLAGLACPEFVERVAAFDGQEPPAGVAPAKPDAAVRKFTFHYRFRVQGLKPTQAGDLVRVWLPAPSSTADQDVTRLPATSPFRLAENRDAAYGNRILCFESAVPSDGTLDVDVPYEIVRREVLRDAAHLANIPQEKLDEVKRALHLKADAMVPTSGKALALLESVDLNRDQLARARQLYDIVDRHVVYKKEGTGWGRGDTNWVCDNGYGNCTDFHSLFMTLARSQGMPARFEIGFSIPTGVKRGPIAGYHCWAWFHHDDRWIPVDISEADKNPEMKDYYFGNLTADRVMFSQGRDLELVPKSAKPPLNFFIYPYIEVAGEPLPKENVELEFAFEEKG